MSELGTSLSGLGTGDALGYNADLDRSLGSDLGDTLGYNVGLDRSLGSDSGDALGCNVGLEVGLLDRVSNGDAVVVAVSFLAQRQKEEVYQGFLKAEAALKWIAENPQIHWKEVQEEWAFLFTSTLRWIIRAIIMRKFWRHTRWQCIRSWNI